MPNLRVIVNNELMPNTNNSSNTGASSSSSSSSSGNRVNGNGGQNDRNVRARTEKRKEPFKRNYKWVKSNICVVKSNHVAKSRPKAFSRNDKHVLLSDLCKDIKDVSQNTESTFAFGILLTIKSINTTPKTASNQFKKSNTDSNKANRMVTFLCPDSSAGQNICVMYFNKSTDWFDWDQGLRDDGTLRPGAFVVIPNPPLLQLTSTDQTPVMEPKMPMVLINGNWKLPTIKFSGDSTSMNGFVLNNCKIYPLVANFMTSKCGGNLCQKQGKVDATICPCFQQSRSSKLFLEMQFKIVPEEGNNAAFTCKFRSPYFFEKLFFKTPIPANASLDVLRGRRSINAIMSCFTEICDKINDDEKAAGIRAIGWVKPGRVVDQGTEQPVNTYMNQQHFVSSSNLIHNVVRIDPQKPEKVDLAELEDLKYDPESFLNDGIESESSFESADEEKDDEDE